MKKYLKYFNNSLKLKKLVEEAYSLIKQDKIKDKLKESMSQIETLLEMLKSHYKGDFKIKKRFFVYIVMAIVYLINPLDLIPDLLIFGLIDDMTVIGWVYTKISSEVDRYQQFVIKKEAKDGEHSSSLAQKERNSSS